MFLYTLSKMNMKDKEIFRKSTLSERFFGSTSYSTQLICSIAKFISMNLYLEKICVINENKNKGKFKFSVNVTCIFVV